MRIAKVKKRNGSVVDFDRGRIERAIEKACVATGAGVASGFCASVADDVIRVLDQKHGEHTPGVEEIQDVVEMTLAERGLFEIAKAYVLYRREHADARMHRQEDILERIERRDIHVTKRSGERVAFDPLEINAAVADGCRGLEEPVDIDGIIHDTERSLYDGITTSEIDLALIMAVRARIERDPVYSTLAASLLTNKLYKEVLGAGRSDPEFSTRYRGRFTGTIRAGVAAGTVDPRLLEFDLERLAAMLDPERDQRFTYLGIQVLYDRYFLRNRRQEILEVPQHFWMRVAMGLAAGETRDRERWAERFYDVISSLRYVPSTPTLFHAGTAHPQMSSCYLTTVKDDLAHILKCIGDNAQLSKWSGGLGNDWTNVRGTGALIRSTNVGSQGVIPFLKIVDATTAAINRSGKRRGATCVYLESWHYDYEHFLELRKNTGDERRRTHDTNTASWIPDLFMKRVLEDGEWTLFSPDETPDLHEAYGREFEQRYQAYERLAGSGGIKIYRRLRARDLWRKMITMLFETGHPWLTFKDPCNIRSPQDHVGVVHSSNLCTEITLNTSADETAVCNLGSVNLARHIENGALNWDELRSTVGTAIRMLDDVIDLNFYPTPEARAANQRHRPVGLGIMGFQDALYLLDLPFDSTEAVAFSDRLLEFISYHAILASSELAGERGRYPSYAGSKWDRGIFPFDTIDLLESERGIETGVDRGSALDWSPVRDHVRRHGMRNSNCMAIAPTATIANIAGCFPAIEPIYKNLYVKSNVSGEFTIVNRYLVQDLKAMGMWTRAIREKIKLHDGSLRDIAEILERLKSKYKEVFEIDPVWIVMHAAHRGKWIDQSQAVNIFTASRSGKAISEIYMTAWRMGLKTTYYLRTLGASSVEKSTLDTNEAEFAAAGSGATPSPTPPEIEACRLDDPACEACQ